MLRHAILAARCLAMASLVACDGSSPDGAAPEPNTPPTVRVGTLYPVTGADSVLLDLMLAGPSRAFTLYGAASDDDGTVASREWHIEGAADFVAVTGDSFSATAPAAEDSDLVCVFRATDNDGAQTLDTVHVWVVSAWYQNRYRIARPAGGEVFHPGDSLRLVMWPAPGAAVANLSDGNEVSWGMGTSQFLPKERPIVRWALPAGVAPGEACYVEVQEYNNPNARVVSGMFAVRP